MTYRQGKRDGTFSRWRNSGEPALEVTYQDGQRSGSYREWYPGGQPALDGAFLDERVSDLGGVCYQVEFPSSLKRKR